ncbi:hypothetical protein F385_3666 [Pantoea agglomerans 299R]|nr:hypothetical protein F385_3666 [Pantoea agglomerans 299R]
MAQSSFPASREKGAGEHGVSSSWFFPCTSVTPHLLTPESG